MTVIPSHLTDAELATCVDEYVKRVFDTFHSEDDFRHEYISITISASAGNYESQYSISHKVNIGYGFGQTVEGNNALEGVRRAMLRLIADKTTPPTKVVRALPAPVDAEYAEFEEVNRIGEVSDDIPY